MSTKIHPKIDHENSPKKRTLKKIPWNFQNYPSIEDTSTKLKKFTLAAQKAQFAKTVNPFYELCSRSTYLCIVYVGVAHSWIMEGIIFWVVSHHHQPPLTSKTSKGPNTKPSIRDNDGRPYCCTLHWTFIFGLELAIQYAYYCWANLFKLLLDYLMIEIDCLEISWNQCLNCTFRTRIQQLDPILYWVVGFLIKIIKKLDNLSNLARFFFTFIMH